MARIATAANTTKAGQAAAKLDSYWLMQAEQEPIMAAQRKAWSSVLEETLMASSCRAELRSHLTGLGRSRLTRAQTQLVVKVFPRQRK